MDKQKTIVEMLKSEMNASEEFSKENFGLKFGDGFRELAMELIEDNHILMYTVSKTLFGMMNFGAFKEFLQAHSESPLAPTAMLRQAVRKNPCVVEDQISMLYFGIQIGRKLAAQEAAALQAMEVKE